MGVLALLGGGFVRRSVPLGEIKYIESNLQAIPSEDTIRKAAALAGENAAKADPDAIAAADDALYAKEVVPQLPQPPTPIMLEADAECKYDFIKVYKDVGNGLFKSLCARAGEADDLLAAAMLIAKGRPTPIDLWQYVRPGISSHPATPPAAEGSAGGGGSEGGDEGGGSHIAPASPSSSLPMWSFLSFAWGIIGDIDIESEVIRCCRLATLALAITLT